MSIAESGITETEKIISKVLSETGADVPRFIVIAVLAGSLLLIINIVSLAILIFFKLRGQQHCFDVPYKQQDILCRAIVSRVAPTLRLRSLHFISMMIKDRC